MTQQPLRSPQTETMNVLRQQAEIRCREDASLSLEQIEIMPPEVMLQTLHDLRVYQIELEMQNEELRQAQVEIAASRARYFDLYDLAPVGYLTLSKTGLILQANLTCATLLGITRSALSKLPITHFILKTDQDIYYRLLNRLHTTGDHQSCDLRMIKNDGSQFWAQLNAGFVPETNDVPTLRLVLSNITERIQAEDELIIRKERFKLLFDRASEGIIILSPNGKIIQVNEAFAHMHGYTAQEMQTMHIRDLDTPESALLAPERAARILAGESLTFETANYHKDGRPILLEVSSSLIVSNGEYLLQAFVRDITERKAMQEALIRYGVTQENEALKLETVMDGLRSLASDSEAALEEEKKFIARELHDELGQLLTALRIEIGLVKMDFGQQVPELLPATGKMLDILDRAVTSMRGVVAHLRPIALDMGLVPALEWLKNDFTRMFRIPCILTCSADIPPLSEIQITTIFRVAQELLTNVAKHANASLVHINLQASDHLLQLSVQDNGIGFDMNASLDSNRFGLLGMRERVMSLDGELLIEATPGKGCCVTLNISLIARRGGR